MSADYIRYKKRKRRLKVKLIITFLLISLLITLIVFLRNASNVLISVCEAAAKSYTTVAVAQAAEKILAEDTDYSSITTITRDSSGNITDIIANAAVINVIARQTAYTTQSILNNLSSQGVDIPVGAFTGIDALAGFGFKIKMKVIPVSTVECSFTSKFTTAGINQTLHSLYIQITTDVSIVTPSKTVNVDASNQILICESVIVGEIPDFLSGGWLSYNGVLVPQSGG